MVTQTVQFVANVSNTQRVRNMKGVDHVVLNMVMLRTGVHAGNLGPVFYSDEELSRSIETWNSMPLVEDHPTDSEGKHISARRMDVLNTSSFGFALNSAHKVTVGDVPGSSHCEAWVNMDDLNRVNPKMAQRVANNEVIEISTGLTLDLIEEAGEWKGQKYTHRAVNFRPDHIALLSKEKGACSVAKGCGVGSTLAVNAATDQVVTNCSCQIKAANKEVPAASPTPPEQFPLTNLRVGNVDASYADLMQQVRYWIEAKYPVQRDSDGGWIKSYNVDGDSLFPNYFVVSVWQRDKPVSHFRINYSLNDGKIVPGTSETPVERQVQFVPVSKTEEGIMTTNTETPVAAPTVIPAVVVANAAPAAVAPVVAPAPAVEQPVIQSVLTLNQFLETTPAHLRPAVNDMVTSLNSARSAHITVIQASPLNKFSVDVLNSMNLDMLAATAALATPAPVVAPAVIVANAAPVVQEAARVLNFSGQAGAPAPAVVETKVRHLIPGAKQA